MKKKQILKWIFGVALLVFVGSGPYSMWLDKHDWDIEKHNPQNIYHVIIDNEHAFVAENRLGKQIALDPDQINQFDETQEFYYNYQTEKAEQPLSEYDVQ